MHEHAKVTEPNGKIPRRQSPWEYDLPSTWRLVLRKALWMAYNALIWLIVIEILCLLGRCHVVMLIRPD